jgi:hypothetical protein
MVLQFLQDEILKIVVTDIEQPKTGGKHRKNTLRQRLAQGMTLRTGCGDPLPTLCAVCG